MPIDRRLQNLPNQKQYEGISDNRTNFEDEEFGKTRDGANGFMQIEDHHQDYGSPNER
jgi:hypothetical protein